MINISEKDDKTVFLGYRQMPDGTKGPAEVKQLCKKCGDVIIAVNGISVVGKTFREVVSHLQAKSAYTYVRFVNTECWQSVEFDMAIFTSFVISSSSQLPILLHRVLFNYLKMQRPPSMLKMKKVSDYY